MIGGPDLLEMNKRIHRREEGTVKPSPPLRDELRNRIYMEIKSASISFSVKEKET